MESTTQSPPTAPLGHPENDRPESRTKPLPSTERDFHTRLSSTASPGFGVALILAVVVLLVAGFFVYRYVSSYESTDDAEVDGHINPISPRFSGHVVNLSAPDNQYCRAGKELGKIDPADS